MKLYHICEFKGHVEIVRVPYSDDEFYADNGYTVWEQALAIASASGIHISRNKDLLLVAKDESGNVLGSVWSSFERDDDQDAWVFDFDVAVSRDSRTHGGLSSARIGPKLIDAALEEFENLKSEFDRVYVKVWVINPKLAHWLEYNRGFEPVGKHGDGSVHMVYYGSNRLNESYEGLEDADRFGNMGDVAPVWYYQNQRDANFALHNIYFRNDDRKYIYLRIGTEPNGRFNTIFVPFELTNSERLTLINLARSINVDDYNSAPRQLCLHLRGIPWGDYWRYSATEISNEEIKTQIRESYDNLEDADEFGGCTHEGCMSPNANWVCSNCGTRFCDDHIINVRNLNRLKNTPFSHLAKTVNWHGARLSSDVDLCFNCLKSAGFKPEQFAFNVLE